MKNNQIEEATTNIQKGIRKVKTNKSKYYLLYANVLKFQNITDSSFYFITKAENDYQSRKIEVSLLYIFSLKTAFYRYFAEKKKQIFVF